MLLRRWSAKITMSILTIRPATGVPMTGAYRCVGANSCKDFCRSGMYRTSASGRDCRNWKTLRKWLPREGEKAFRGLTASSPMGSEPRYQVRKADAGQKIQPVEKTAVSSEAVVFFYSLISRLILRILAMFKR